MSVFEGLPRVIEPADLASRLQAPELILVDLTNAERYAAGHIPGAHFVDPKRTQLGQPPAPGLLPEWSDLEGLFTELGHRADAVYVLYDAEGGPWAGRFAWLLDFIGHDRWHYLNGGLTAWEADARELSNATPATASAAVHLCTHEAVLATRDSIQQNLGNANVLIWDARSPEEYRGEKVLAAKGGHIPGAINLEWTQLHDRNNALRIRPDAADVLAAHGIHADKTIITHCQTHRRSGFTYLVMRSLGFPQVQAYAGSWSEWGNHPETPVEV